jgi:hypothetical protein
MKTIDGVPLASLMVREQKKVVDERPKSKALPPPFSTPPLDTPTWECRVVEWEIGAWALGGGGTRGSMSVMAMLR